MLHLHCLHHNKRVTFLHLVALSHNHLRRLCFRKRGRAGQAVVRGGHPPRHSCSPAGVAGLQSAAGLSPNGYPNSACLDHPAGHWRHHSARLLAGGAAAQPLAHHWPPAGVKAFQPGFSLRRWARNLRCHSKIMQQQPQRSAPSHAACSPELELAARHPKIQHFLISLAAHRRQ